MLISFKIFLLIIIMFMLMNLKKVSKILQRISEIGEEACSFIPIWCKELEETVLITEIYPINLLELDIVQEFLKDEEWFNKITKVQNKFKIWIKRIKRDNKINSSNRIYKKEMLKINKLIGYNLTSKIQMEDLLISMHPYLKFYKILEWRKENSLVYLKTHKVI